jgi:hypothetical protein
VWVCAHLLLRRSDTTLRAFAITSVADLAAFKWAARAEALVTLAAYEHSDGHS